MPEWLGQIGAIGIVAAVLYVLGQGLIKVMSELIAVIRETTSNYDSVRKAIDRQSDNDDRRATLFENLIKEVQGNSIITASVKDAVAAAQKASELAASESALTRKQIEDVTRRIQERGLEVERALLPAVWALDTMQRDVQKYLETAPDGMESERYKLMRGFEVALDTHIGLLLDGSRKLLTDAARQLPPAPASAQTTTVVAVTELIPKPSDSAEGDTRP